MFLNKGKVDQSCHELRGTLLPITITNAQKTIEILCGYLAALNGQANIKVNTITTKDFVHFFYQQPGSSIKSIKVSRRIQAKHNMTGSFRRIK